MKSFFNLFKNNKEESPRDLVHPKDLLVGDIVVMDDGFDLPKQLRGEQFEVTEIQSYQYEHEKEISFVLKGLHGVVFLGVEDDDGECLLTFSLEVERDDVSQLFDLDEFANVFDSEDAVHLQRVTDLERTQLWTAKHYHQTSKGERGYFYAEDLRSKKLSEFEDHGEPLDYFSLENDTGQFLVEIEVSGEGDTEVCLSIVRPLADIKELWPAKG